jgi:hypothetical protein
LNFNRLSAAKHYLGNNHYLFVCKLKCQNALLIVNMTFGIGWYLHPMHASLHYPLWSRTANSIPNIFMYGWGLQVTVIVAQHCCAVCAVLSGVGLPFCLVVSVERELMLTVGWVMWILLL